MSNVLFFGAWDKDEVPSVPRPAPTPTGDHAYVVTYDGHPAYMGSPRHYGIDGYFAEATKLGGTVVWAGFASGGNNTQIFFRTAEAAWAFVDTLKATSYRPDMYGVGLVAL